MDIGVYTFLCRYVLENWLTDMNEKYKINIEKFVKVMVI